MAVVTAAVWLIGFAISFHRLGQIRRTAMSERCKT